jgi:hypothetical protein
VHTKISTEGNLAVFHMAVSGKAGASKPSKSGKLAGSTVLLCVADVFKIGSGNLSLPGKVNQ